MEKLRYVISKLKLKTLQIFHSSGKSEEGKVKMGNEARRKLEFGEKAWRR